MQAFFVQVERQCVGVDATGMKLVICLVNAVLETNGLCELIITDNSSRINILQV